MKIEKWDIENLKRVLEYWDTLSNNTEALDCMTDHCHTEYHDAKAFIEDLDNIASQLEPLVMQKTAGIDPVIMNITQERYERVMNLLDNIEHKKMEITFNQFIKDKMDGDYKIAKLIEQIEIMQKTASDIKHTLSSFSA